MTIFVYQIISLISLIIFIFKYLIDNIFRYFWIILFILLRLIIEINIIMDFLDFYFFRDFTNMRDFTDIGDFTDIRYLSLYFLEDIDRFRSGSTYQFGSRYLTDIRYLSPLSSGL